MELSKNQIIPLDITGTTAEGSGIGRAKLDGEGSGLAVIVPFTAVGDRIQCRILKVEKNLAYGRVEELMTPSGDRVQAESDCPVFGRCGGCAWRHVTYDAELRYKQQRVADALRRIGGLDVEIRPIIGSENAEHYRNKAQYPVRPGPYRPMIGFYAPRSHRVVEQHACVLQPVIFETIVEIVFQWAKKTGLPIYDETTRKGILRHIYIREAESTGEIQVCLVCASGKLPDTHELIETLRERVPGLQSVVVNLNREDTNVVLGGNGFTLWGQDFITDELCGLRFRLSPRSFYQVNRRQAEILYGIAAAFAEPTPEDTLLDLYCGTGTIGLSMAGRTGEVIGVETVAEAVEDAQRNAEENGIGNARFLCADAGDAAAQLRREGVRPTIVVLDPPRKGCSPAVIDTVAEMEPERVVYVSCDPATLARDLKRFAEKGYKTEAVQPVDMFPRTPHVETVAVLSRKSATKTFIPVTVSPKDMGLDEAKAQPTYENIRKYVKETHGLTVSTLNIAQMKAECGLEMECDRSGGKQQPKCPPEKREAILDAFRHFGMIGSDTSG